MSKEKMKATTIFIEMIEKHIDPRSQALYRCSVRRFKKFLYNRDKEDSLNTINRDLLEEFVEDLNQSTLQYKTIHNYEGAIITLINYANNDKSIRANINIIGHKRIEDHRSKDQKKSKQIPLTEEQLYTIYKLNGLTKKEEEAKDLFIAQCLLGQRISDMPKIFKGDYSVQLTKEGLEIISFCVQKTKEEATIYLFPIAKQIIEKYRDQGFRYFDLLSGNETIIKRAYNSLNSTIKSVCKKARLDSDENFTTQIGKKLVPQRKKLYSMIHTQTARHTFITLMCKHGVPKEDVIIATAHTDTKMIDNVYFHETVCDRGHRLIEAYRDIKKSHFFIVEKQSSIEQRKRRKKIKTIIIKLLCKIIDKLNQ